MIFTIKLRHSVIVFAKPIMKSNEIDIKSFVSYLAKLKRQDLCNIHQSINKSCSLKYLQVYVTKNIDFEDFAAFQVNLGPELILMKGHQITRLNV